MPVVQSGERTLPACWSRHSAETIFTRAVIAKEVPNEMCGFPQWTKFAIAKRDRQHARAVRSPIRQPLPSAMLSELTTLPAQSK